jgi:uncharacterized membrane protein (UPF0127 family)
VVSNNKENKKDNSYNINHMFVKKTGFIDSSKTKHNIITEKVFVQNSFFSKATGLMFKKQMNDFAMIFPFKSPRKIKITMFFVSFPIDVIFIDKYGLIVELKENLKPYEHYFSKTKETKTFIELPKGYIEKFSLQLGTRIFWNTEKLTKISKN